MVAIVEQGQCLIDVTIQHCGDLESLFSMASQNGISVTDKVNIGSELRVASQSNVAMAKYIKENAIVPATAGGINKAISGIGYDIIGLTLKVYE